MANIIGMDPEAVETLSKDLKTQAGRVAEVISKIDGLVSHMQGIWKGQDAEQFASSWRDHHRKALHTAQVEIEDLGKSALRNANEQRQVSAR